MSLFSRSLPFLLFPLLMATDLPVSSDEIELQPVGAPLSQIPPLRNEPFPSPLIRTHEQLRQEITRRQSSSAELARYFNREEYIRHQIDSMIASEEELKEKINRAQSCANLWTTASALTTTAVLTISVIGATDYIDPKLTSLLASCGAGLNGFFMWAALQYKKTERIESEKQKKIREALGVPPRLILPDFSTSFDQFKSPE